MTGPVTTLTAKGSKVALVAVNEEAAEILLTQYALEIGLDVDAVPEREWAASVRIATTDQDGYGLEQARDTLLGDLRDRKAKASADTRRARLADDKQFLDDASPDGVPGVEHAVAILQQVHDRYVAHPDQFNFSYGPTLTARQVADARDVWDGYADYDESLTVFRNFHSTDPQDKKAAGKAAVPGTLELRGVQSNFMVKIGNLKFNCHVNVRG